LKQRPLITILLALSCIASAVILGVTPAYNSFDDNSADNLDSLITSTLRDEPLIGSNFRRYNIQIDSTFTRTVFRVPVHPNFSKTMFHYALHKKLTKFEIDSPARVIFPEKDMYIYIYEDGTIKSTIRLITTEPNIENE
jgi:hypothetical protein